MVTWSLLVMESFRSLFVFQEHLNFIASASRLGNLLLSVRHEEEKEQEFLHVIIRYTHTHRLWHHDINLCQSGEGWLVLWGPGRRGEQWGRRASEWQVQGGVTAGLVRTRTKTGGAASSGKRTTWGVRRERDCQNKSMSRTGFRGRAEPLPAVIANYREEKIDTKQSNSRDGDDERDLLIC